MGPYNKERYTGSNSRQIDDQALWEKVTQTVRKMNPQPPHNSDKQIKIEKADLKSKTQTEHPKSSKSFPLKIKTVSDETTLVDLRLGEASGIDRSSARRLKRGQLKIEDRLDLHGLSQERARKRLISFITSAVQKNFRHVLIITGKGREGQGVLRQQVPIWLKDAPLRKHINAISYAQPQDGGTGALYIRLKRQRREAI